MEDSLTLYSASERKQSSESQWLLVNLHHRQPLKNTRDLFLPRSVTFPRLLPGLSDCLPEEARQMTSLNSVFQKVTEAPCHGRQKPRAMWNQLLLGQFSVLTGSCLEECELSHHRAMKAREIEPPPLHPPPFNLLLQRCQLSDVISHMKEVVGVGGEKNTTTQGNKQTTT